MAGPSRQPKKAVTMAEFEDLLDSTPLFMKETPKDGKAQDNEVLEALRSLVFEGEGNGMYRNAYPPSPHDSSPGKYLESCVPVLAENG